MKMNDGYCGLNLSRTTSEWFNDATFFDYYMRLKEIAINSYEWVNLPPTCDPRFLELILFEFGYCLFFKYHLNDAFLTLQCALTGPLNIYRVPINRRAYSITQLQQSCNDQDSVIVWNNFLRQPTALTVQLYAERLTRIQRAIDVNINAQKTPILIKGSQAQQRSLKSIYKSYEGNEPVIFGDKDMNSQMLEVFRTDAPESYTNLEMEKTRVWNEAITFLGGNNANTDKKERLITNEVNSNLEQIIMQRMTFLDARKQACQMINDLFGSELPNGKIDVRYRKMEVEDGGTIYDGTQDSNGRNDRSNRERNISADQRRD